MSKVVIKKCTAYDVNDIIEKINSGMEFLGGWSKFLHPGMKVLLKVNLIGPKTSDSAAVTHCEFVRAVTRILRSRGCIVWIGDSSGGAIAGIAPTAKSFIVSGLEKVAAEEGAEIKNFEREGVLEVKRWSNPSEKMYIAKPMYDADLVINLPKFKTHTAGIYTGAVKNMFGCIPGLRKAEYHKNAPNPLEFGEVIADINKSIKVGLHIMDGISAMQGEGPTAGEVYTAEKILISTDPLALDTVAAKMIGIDIEQIPILQASIKRGHGDHELNSIKLYGDYNEIPVLKDFKLPKTFGVKKKKNNSKALSSVVKLLKSRPKINIKKCKKCNMCIESCPVQAINNENKIIDYSKCIECLCCHELCLHQAVELKRDNPLVGLLLKFYKGAYK
jgi:uncharacterized protein (DUF362 family)/NAD-dependent dihydropyrimidine dehydrogenase PreA subunit